MYPTPTRGSRPKPARVCVALVAALAALLALAAAMTPARAKADPGNDEQLTAARALAANGRYREAADALLLLLDAGAANDSRVLIALAECHEGLQDWTAAAGYYRSALAVTTDGEARAALVFRRANALQRAGAYLQAARLYRLFVALRPDSYARDDTLLRIGDCYTAGGLPAVAIGYYSRAVANLSAGSGRIDALLRLADAFALAGKPGEALTLLDSEAATVPPDDYARYQYRWAQAERAAGDEAAGLARLDSLYRSRPRSYYAYLALIDLIDAGATVDEYQRGLVDYYAEAYEPAVAAFQRYVEANPGGYDPAAHYYAGLSYRAQKLYAEAIAQFDLLINGYPDATNYADAVIAKAQALDRSGDDESAIDTYLGFVDAHSDAPRAAEALYAAAALLEGLGRTEEAEKAYSRLYATYPGSEQAPLAALHAGVIAYRASRWSDAEAYLGQAAGLCGECSNANRYRFWQARALLAQQRRDEAADLLAVVAGSAPSDYYSYRAWVLLQGTDPMTSSSGGNILAPDAAARTAAEDWLRQAVDPTWQPGTTPASLATDSRFQAMQELLALGLRDWVVDLALDLGDDLRQDNVACYCLAVWLRDAGLYRPSIQIAANIVYTHADATESVPPFIWSLVYPLYYSDLVLEETGANAVDPLLYFALIRQESLFDASIGSSAGAQGLAQIMPSTGAWIAEMLGDGDYSDSSLLLPYVSVRYGVWYLAQQLAYLGGDRLAALVAYNAGPGNAATWLEQASGDPDVFYETVPYAETRRYLDTVVPNYYQYRRLYCEASTE